MAAPHIISVGLRLSDEKVRVAAELVSFTNVHVVKRVDARGLHGLACRRSVST